MKHYTSTKLYLSIYQPSTVLAGRINDPHPSTGMTEIAYDWMDGDSTYVKSGQIMYVGTTFGGRDRGKVRVRSATYQVITVAQNSDILWADNLYITIVNYHPIFPIYQKAQEIGNTPQTADILVWKDEDIEYVNQNDYPGSLICMGSHRAAMLENGSNTQYWSATGTVNTNGNSLSYEWEFEGGTPDTSTSQTPGAVTYNTAGHYVTSLSVTSSSGTVDTSYRYVSIYDAAHPPVEKWGMKDLRGSRSEGGYNTSLWIKEPLVNIIPGALIVIFSDNYNHLTGENDKNRIEFVGYVMNGTIEYDYQTSTVSFDVGSVMDVMKTVEVPGVVLTSTASPSSWVEMNNVTMQKALWFFLRWHTTVMMSTDVQYLGTNYMMFRFESDNAKIGDILITFMQTAVIGSAVANRQGQLFFETDPIAIHNAPTVLPLIASLDRNYWMDKVEIQQAVDPEVSYVEMYGYSYSSVTGSSTIYRACAPGVTPSSAGNMEEFNGMSVNNQQEINRIVGDIYAYRNATYPNIGMALKGHYPELEFVPNQKYYLTIESNDSWSHVRETNLPIHPTTLVWKYDPLNLFYAPEAEFHEITVGTSGTTLHIPDTTFDNPAWIPTEFDIPPWTPYNFPPWNPPLIPPEPPALAGCENWNDPPENSYAAYPEFPILGPTRPYTYIWFPCVVRKYPLFDWSKQSYIEVDSTDNSGFYSVDVVRQDKSIIYSASMTPHPYPVSIGIFTPAAYIEAAGFKINWNYHDPTYPYIIGLNAGGYSAIIGVWDGWAGWQTSPGKSMGFVEAEANLSNWPHITPWGTGWYVHLTGSYAGVTQERIQIKKLSGGAEAIVLIPGSYYIAGTDEFFKGGYNMHAAASLTLTSPGDTGYRGETAHAAITYSGNYCFGIGSYWDDAFAPTPHASSYQILALELYYSGAWHVVWGPGVETGTISTRIQNVYIYNICPPIS